MDFELTEQEILPSPTHKDNIVSSSSSNAIIEVNVDEALDKSEFGRFQYFTQFLITCISIGFGYQAILSYFIAHDPPWKCIRNNTSKFCEQNFGVNIGSDNKLFSSRCILDRGEWTYTTDKKYSIVTEFDLVCEKTAVAALSSSIIHVGGGLGILISGLAAGYYGRKPVLIVSLCILTAFSIACTYVTNTFQLIILRAFLGTGHNVSYNISYVYLSELAPPSYRTIVSMGYCIGYVISEMLIDAVAYYCRYWRKIQLYASFPCILGIGFLFLLPESPRWLMVNGKQLEAETTLKRIAKCNGSKLHPIILKSPTISNEKRYTYWHLFQNRKVAVVTMLQAVIWFTAGMSYYTTAFESSNLGGDMYQAFALTSLVEIPSKFVSYLICNRFGRKKSTLIPLVLTAGFAASTILIPKTVSFKYVFNIIFMMFARFFADVTMQGLYLWTFELFPTVLRLQGMGCCVVLERAGSFVAPFITSVLQPVNATLPYIILMVFAVTAAGGGIFLPETNKKPTRERYEDFFETPLHSNIVIPNKDERIRGDIQQKDD